MSSLGSAMNSALRSLEANQVGLAVASNNIANANTPGYTRERVIMQPAASLGGRFAVGAGVEVVGTEALRDRLIERRLWEETSSQAENDLRHRSLSDVEMLFNESESTGLLPLMTKFFNSFHALSAEPSSSNRRLEVTTNAEALSNFFEARGGELRDIQTSIDRSIQDDVTRINSLVSEIATLTTRITETETYQPAHELRDQRSSLIQRLSQIVEIHELETDGTYQLSLGNNRPLVFAGTAVPLTVAASSTGDAIVKSGNEDITSELNGGQLKARLTLRDEDLPRYMDQLDQLAFELAREVNEVHSTGYDLDGGTGTNFFAPLASSSDAARNLQLAAAIAADPRKIAVGDQVDGTGNNNAIQLGNLLHAQVFTGGSITEQYRGFVFAVGSDTANADLGTRQHQALLHQLENRRQSASGVSIDEETVKILQFQRAFEASARIVRVVDELLQVALSIGT